MGAKPGHILPPGVTIRDQKQTPRIQVAFTWNGAQCRELLPVCPISKSNIQHAANLRAEIRRKISDGSFNYAAYFPDSPRAKAEAAASKSVRKALDDQLETYRRQVTNGKLSPSTFQGYAKSIVSERMHHWDDYMLHEITPAALREWISEMDCTSKAIRNTLIPLRSVLEDALNDELIDCNPFEKIALTKLIRQTSRASDYVIQPFTQAERESILKACRPDEWPMFQFWFNTGLRPGELQAVEWQHINWEKSIVRIEQNQVAGVIKAPKTAAGIRTVDLNQDAIEALKTQYAVSGNRGSRIWLNPSTMTPWETDAQVRKNSWLPLMRRSGIPYRNPYQIRHTYASSILTDGENPWYVAEQLGHQDVEMVFRTYGKFIREDYRKPIVGSSDRSV